MAELAPIETALEALLQDAQALDNEPLALTDAAGRVLAEDVKAQLDVPPFDNSAMDGYALRAAEAGQQLLISQRIAAGSGVKPLMPCIKFPSMYTRTVSRVKGDGVLTEKETLFPAPERTALGAGAVI
ncbi:MAG: hypothetical protein R6U42_06990 [Halomonas sp.]